ncbi:hypothetical protein Q8A73_008086 [Channa argus]|nr:hypothetical protein Q8A73_008086 [Channa argus]
MGEKIARVGGGVQLECSVGQKGSKSLGSIKLSINTSVGPDGEYESVKIGFEAVVENRIGLSCGELTFLCEGRPANPVRLFAILKHSSGTAAGVFADFQEAQTDASPGNFNGVLIV